MSLPAEKNQLHFGLILVKVIHYTVTLVTVSLIYVQIIRFSLSADNRSVQQQALGIPDISWSL